MSGSAAWRISWVDAAVRRGETSRDIAKAWGTARRQVGRFLCRHGRADLALALERNDRGRR